MGVQLSLLDTDFNSFECIFPGVRLLNHIVVKHKTFLQSWSVFQVQSYQAHSLNMDSCYESFFKDILQAKIQMIQE